MKAGVWMHLIHVLFDYVFIFGMDPILVWILIGVQLQRLSAG